MKRPPRDTVEFTAGVVLGALVGAGLTRIALGRGGESSEASAEARGLAETFFEAVGTELGTVLRETAGAALRLGRSTNGGSG